MPARKTTKRAREPEDGDDDKDDDFHAAPSKAKRQYVFSDALSLK
jgi:hypothetical protein